MNGIVYAVASLWVWRELGMTLQAKVVCGADDVVLHWLLYGEDSAETFPVCVRKTSQ